MPEAIFDLLGTRSSSTSTAIVWNGEPISYAALHTAADDIADELARRGVEHGDVVTLLFSNCPAFVAAYFACWRLGAIANPLNSRLSPTELSTLIDHAGSRALLYEEALEWLVRDSLHDLRDPALADAAQLRMQEGALWRFERTGIEEPPTPRPRAEPRGSGKQPAALIYTSGTTARSKGVLLSHDNILADAFGLSNRLGIDSQDRTLCFMPLFHCNALIFSHLSTFTVGGSVVLTRRFSASNLWDLIDAHGAHSFSCPPTVLAILLERTPPNRQTPTSLRFVKVGAAPLGDQLATSFEQRFRVPLVEGYGMTEGTATSTMHDPRLPRPTGTVGHALSGQRLRIVDADDNELPPDAVGEIQISGETVMLGYHRDPELTASTVIDGWLRTGDLGALSDDGQLRLTGRQKEIIIRGGENIAPIALDEVIGSHPDVVDCAVYGVPDPIWGESPAAAVVTKPTLDLDDLRRFVQERVADFEIPVVFTTVGEIPRNAVGKIQRHLLADSHPASDPLPTEGRTHA